MPPRPESPASRQTAALRLAGVDGLRGVAALSVLAYHVALSCGLTTHGPLPGPLAELKAGVALFFVISGCVLWLPFASAMRTGQPRPDVRRFARRRAARILPGYWVALTVLAVLPWSSIFGHGSLRYYALAQIYSSHTVLRGLGPAWSLCVELTFYLSLMLMAICLGRRGLVVSARSQLGVLGCVAVIAIASRWELAGSALGHVPHRGFIAMTALSGCADWFALGMALAVALAAHRAASPLPRALVWLLAREWLCWAIVGALTAAAGFAQGNDAFLPLWGPLPHLEIGVAAALALATVTLSRVPGRGARARRALSAAPVRWLGEVSYGIYLWNVIVVQVVVHGLVVAPPHASTVPFMLMRLGVVTAGTLACAAASWYAIERPLLRAGRARMGAPAHSAA